LDQLLVLVPLVQKLVTEGETITMDLTQLTTQVARNKDAIQSGITVMKGIKKALDDAIASEDPAALTALSASLGENTDALAAAIVESTQHA